METPAQRCARLVAAFKEMMTDEASALRARDFAAADAVAERAGPIVNWLAAHPGLLTPSLGEELAAACAIRASNAALLAAQMAATSDELRQVALSRRRVAKFAPVYAGAVAAGPSRLSAVG